MKLSKKLQLFFGVFLTSASSLPAAHAGRWFPLASNPHTIHLALTPKEDQFIRVEDLKDIQTKIAQSKKRMAALDATVSLLAAASGFFAYSGPTLGDRVRVGLRGTSQEWEFQAFATQNPLLMRTFFASTLGLGGALVSRILRPLTRPLITRLLTQSEKREIKKLVFALQTITKHANFFCQAQGNLLSHSAFHLDFVETRALTSSDFQSGNVYLDGKALSLADWQAMFPGNPFMAEFQVFAQPLRCY